MNAGLKGVILAGSVAALFGCSKGSTAKNPEPAPSGTAASGATVKCSGINKCSGQSECAIGETACAGQNKCSGQGWIKVPAEECTEKGGKVI